MEDIFLALLQISLGVREELPRIPNSREWERLYELAEEQAVTGLLLHGLERLPVDQLPPVPIKLQWIGVAQIIQQQNKVMNQAVVGLCKEMEEAGIKIIVFKGQTLTSLYPDGSLRQSGDIDFYCYPEELDKAMEWFKNNWHVDPCDTNNEKHVTFIKDDVDYEMHNRLSSFTYPKHGRYWEQVVMPEIKANPYFVDVGGYAVPSLFPIYNVLFVFIHIFYHLISEGIGIRQFCDWQMTLLAQSENGWNKEDVELLEKHLKGIGLLGAFTGLGAVLTDYLGLPVERFPFAISEKEHQQSEILLNNIIEYGHYGHSDKEKLYLRESGVIHGMQHLLRIVKQSCRFGHYAPAESWWRVIHLIKWWGKKLVRMVKNY